MNVKAFGEWPEVERVSQCRERNFEHFEKVFFLPAALVPVVETPEFIRRAEKLMTESDREELIGYLAANPTAGDLIPRTGGVRKFAGAWTDAESAAARGSSISFTIRICRCSS